MSAMSDYLEEAFLHWQLDQTVYVGLAVSGAFTDSSYETEAAGHGYVRQQVVSGEWVVADEGGGVWKGKNTDALTFPEADGAYSDDVVGWGIFDSLTSGNLLIHEVCSAQAIGDGVNPYIAASGIVVEPR